MIGVRPERSEIEGLPVYWAEAPPPFTAALVFRVGRADETLATSGLCHLVEHLALFPIGRTPFYSNGHVEDLWTAFYAMGTPEETLGFLASVAENLARLPLDRLETETRILQTEGASRSPGWRDRLLELRFGPRGFGLSSYEELGLRVATEDAVEAWARERFVRENAAVWMTAAPPDDFDLSLPRGRRFHAPAFPLRPRLDLPAHFAEGGGGVSIGTIGARQTALSTGLGIARHRAEELLRRQSGLSYSVVGTYEPLDADHTHLAIGADCLDEHGAAVQSQLLDGLRSLAEDGPTEEDLARAHEDASRAIGDPANARGWLDYAVRDELLGAEVLSPDEIIEQAAGLVAGEVAEAISACLPEVLVVAPAGTRRPDGLVEYGKRGLEPVTGRSYRERPLRVGKHVRIVRSDEGITLHQRGGVEPVTLLFSECVAVLRWNPQRITLISADSSWIEISARQFHDGERLIRVLLESLPATLVIPMEDVQTLGSLADLAANKLGRSGVVNEFNALPGHLHPGEKVENLAQVNTFGRRGLLALTDRRLVWVWRGVVRRGQSVDSVDLASLERVEGSDRGTAMLNRVSVRAKEGRVVKLRRFTNRERAREFRRALEDRLG